MLRTFVNCAKTVLPALTSGEWCYQNAFMIVNYRKEKNISKVRSATNFHRPHLNWLPNCKL